MFLLRFPKPQKIEQFLLSQRSLPYTYDEIGATQRTPPAGYNVDNYRVMLGTGEEIFTRASQALRDWKMYPSWISIFPLDKEIATDNTIAIVIRHFGFHSINSCRLIYIIDENNDTLSRFGFAVGTLAGHAEQGEERFLLEWNHQDDAVWFDIFAFSRPRHWLARIGYPLMRLLQKRFGKDSREAMQQAVATT